MKLVSLLFFVTLLASCGKDGGSGSSSPMSQNMCQVEGRYVACESLNGDGLGVDQLETMIDVPVQITDSEIQFMSDKSASSQGRRISCRVGVKKGEIYRFALRGARLLVMTSEGSFEMDRLSSGDGIVGSWVWQGYEDQGTHLIRQMSFLSNSRMVLITKCEL